MAEKHITFVSDGLTVVCTNGSEIKITSAEGLAAIETELQTIVSPFMPGAQTNHIQVLPRAIEMTMEIPVERRDFYLSFFRVNSTGTMTALLGDSERFIDYIITVNKPTQATVCTDIAFNLTLHCGYPYFKDVYGFGENLGASVPLYATPFVWLVDQPLVVSYTKFDRNHAITNTGEVPVGIYLRIKSTGRTVNPKVMLTDKENVFIRVLVDLQINDELEISTVIENGNTPNTGKDIFVKLNGENILNRTDQNSSLSGFQIEPGRHMISYTADDGAENMQLWLYRNWAWSWA